MKEKENEIELLYSAGTLSLSLLGECPGLAMETDTQLLSCRAPTIFTLFWTLPLKWWILSPSPGLMRQRMKWVSEGNDCRQAQLYYFNLLLLLACSVVWKYYSRSINVFQPYNSHLYLEKNDMHEKYTILLNIFGLFNKHDEQGMVIAVILLDVRDLIWIVSNCCEIFT